MSFLQPYAPTLPPARASGGLFQHQGLWAPGVRLFRHLRFGAKAGLILLAFGLPLLLLLAWQVKGQYDAALQARREATQHHVEVAHGVVAWAHAQQLAGRMSQAQAQAMALQQLASLRYGQNEYFWVNDLEPRVVMHPIKPALDGQPVGGLKDPNGLALFQAFVDVARRDGAGFVAYQWPKPGREQPVDKVAYVKAFAPWGWVVGSGLYLDDLRDALLAQLRLEGVVLVLTLGVCGYLFGSFYRVMDGGLRETRRHVLAMTEGDLTTEPTPWGRDEAAQLLLDVRAMQGALRGMVQRVRGSSDRILSASGEVAGGAQDLSARTEQAAASLQQSAASMEQVSATVRQTSDHTVQAAREAERNAAVAAEGGRAMAEVEHTMDGIRSASTRIAEIIGTIDGIAFQTNILSLNAAVEAARAGEQGRGFAVVASEVRTLAQRSAEAARQIKDLIQGSVEQVAAGSGTVRRAGGTIAEIVASSQRVSQLLGEIASGAREQAAGVGQIGTAVGDLDRMTQQNAALVEQTAAAAQAMRDQAGTLSAEVARFRLPA